MKKTQQTAEPHELPRIHSLNPFIALDKILSGFLSHQAHHRSGYCMRQSMSTCMKIQKKKNFTTATYNFFMFQRNFSKFIITKSKNLYQHIYKLEEVSRKHYGKEVSPR